MNPTFKQIWGMEPWVTCGYHPQVQYKRPRNYYRFRSIVRIAFWAPLATYGYYLVMSSI